MICDIGETYICHEACVQGRGMLWLGASLWPLHSFVPHIVSDFPASTFSLCMFLHVSGRKLPLKKAKGEEFWSFLYFMFYYIKTQFFKIIISSYYHHLRTLLLLLSFYKLIFWCNGKSEHLPTENVWLFAERLKQITALSHLRIFICSYVKWSYWFLHPLINQLYSHAINVLRELLI